MILTRRSLSKQLYVNFIVYKYKSLPTELTLTVKNNCLPELILLCLPRDFSVFLNAVIWRLFQAILP